MVLAEQEAEAHTEEMEEKEGIMLTLEAVAEE